MTAIEEIAAERKRQIERKGWTAAHDDSHRRGELAHGAAAYAIGSTHAVSRNMKSKRVKLWPWSQNWWKPKDRRRDLIKAGALIVAEIERLDRAAPPKGDQR